VVQFVYTVGLYNLPEGCKNVQMQMIL